MGVLQLDLVAHPMAEQHRAGGHIPQEADPGEILRPAEVDRQHIVHPGGHESVDGALHILGGVDDAGEGHFRDGGGFLGHPFGFLLLALQIAAPGRALADGLEAFGGDQQQSHPGTAVQIDHDGKPPSEACNCCCQGKISFETSFIIKTWQVIVNSVFYFLHKTFLFGFDRWGSFRYTGSRKKEKRFA